MKRFKKFKPAFWEHYHLYGSHPHTTINFARKWKMIVLFTSFNILSTLSAIGDPNLGHVGPPLPNVTVSLKDVSEMQYYAKDNKVGNENCQFLALC